MKTISKPKSITSALTAKAVLAFIVGVLVGGATIGVVDTYFSQPLFSDAQVGGAGGGVGGWNATGSGSTTGSGTGTWGTPGIGSGTGASGGAGVGSNTKCGLSSLSAAQIASIETQTQAKYAQVRAEQLAKGAPQATANAIASATSKALKESLVNTACAKLKGGTGTSTGTGSSTGTSTGSGSGGATIGTSDGSGVSAGAGLSNDQINSSVQVSGGDFDRVLGRFDNLLEFESVPELIVRLINIGLLLAAMAAVLVIIWGGFNMVTAAGNESRLTKGKTAVLWAVGGLIVCLLSFTIVAIIERVIAR